MPEVDFHFEDDILKSVGERIEWTVDTIISIHVLTIQPLGFCRDMLILVLNTYYI